jgi:hypothetical protein
MLRNSVDRAVERAGSEAAAALDAARRAAREGNQEEARRLLSQLEEQVEDLTPEQARLLRAELGLDTPAGLRPPGAVEQPDARQVRLLEESGLVESGGKLTQEQLDNELAMVRRSQPQPTQEPGYVDEVDLGNGHRWRRREDETWCRFSPPSLCGTVISGVAPHGAAPNWQAALLDKSSPYYNPEAVERLNRILERVRALGIDIDMNEVVEDLTAFRGPGRRATRLNEALDVIEAEFDRVARVARGESGAPFGAEDLREQGFLPSTDTGDAQSLLEDAILGGPGGLSIRGKPVLLTGIDNEVQTQRSALRRRMLNAGLAPGWEPWNAHHVIPWELRYHGVFDILRVINKGDWDHNRLENGFPLPTREHIKGAENLPVHQLPGPGRGHPGYNADVSKRLDNLLEAYRDDPVRLRQEVMTLMDDLKGELDAGGWRGHVF